MQKHHKTLGQRTKRPISAQVEQDIDPATQKLTKKIADRNALTVGDLVDEYIENQHLFLSITGRRLKENWNSTNDQINFFDLKEYVSHIGHARLLSLLISFFDTKKPSFSILRASSLYFFFFS